MSNNHNAITEHNLERLEMTENEKKYFKKKTRTGGFSERYNTASSSTVVIKFLEDQLVKDKKTINDNDADSLIYGITVNILPNVVEIINKIIVLSDKIKTEIQVFQL